MDNDNFDRRKLIDEVLELQEYSGNLGNKIDELRDESSLLKKQTGCISKIYRIKDTRYSEEELNEILIAIYSDLEKIEDELAEIEVEMKKIKYRISEILFQIEYLFN